MCKIKREWSLGKIYLASSTEAKEIHELRDLTIRHSIIQRNLLCQDKFTIKDVKLRISIIIISSRLKGVVKPQTTLTTLLLDHSYRIFFLISRRINFVPFTWKYKLFCNDQQDQRQIHFKLCNCCEDELVFVIPNPLRACSLQFLDDWQIS